MLDKLNLVNNMYVYVPKPMFSSWSAANFIYETIMLFLDYYQKTSSSNNLSTQL